MDLIKGCPSTSMDNYQLNTTTLIRHAARNFPEREIVYRTDEGVFRYNYKEAYQRVAKLAAALKQLGVQPGDRIGVLDWNSRRFFEAYFAIPGIGAVLLQMNLRLAPVELEYVANHSEAQYILVDESLLSIAEEIAPKLKTVKGYIIMTDKDPGAIETTLPAVHYFENLLAQVDSETYEWPVIDETSAYSACYTSGTTGAPKGVYYSHRCIYLHAMMYALYANIRHIDTLVQLVPMFHAQGWGIWQSAVLMGAKIVLPGRYTLEDAEVLVDLMNKEKMTVMMGAPALFMAFLQEIEKMDPRPDFSSGRIICGATEPPLSMMKGYKELTGAQFVHIYGATETAPLCLCNLLKPSLEEKLSAGEKWELMKKQGMPVPGLDVKLVDLEGKEITRDGVTAGEILVRGPWVTGAYYNDDRNKDSFVDGYWKSGDAGAIDAEGYVKIVDRYKDLIKSGGEWISSIDLENAMAANPDIEEATVVGIEHPKWEERPLALVVLKDRSNSKKISPEDILEFIAPKFAKWQLPDKVMLVDEIPKTSVGKYNKKEIRKTYKNVYMG